MCPVCFTGGDAATRETLNAGIGVLMGVTVIVLALFARFFLRLARRSREFAHLVEHDGTKDGTANAVPYIRRAPLEGSLASDPPAQRVA
jgi:hypothetical protein